MDGKRHLPSLDGWRGVSILMVLVGHGGRTMAAPRPLSFLDPISNIGVAVFFVLSGFLITTLLMDERARTGTIALRRFYLRRVLRILPASYAYVGVVALLAALGLIALKPGDVACALLYVVDYHHDRAWYLGHYWSLSVEEQFYLLWPPALAIVGRRRAGYLALVLLAVAELIPSAAVQLSSAWPPDLRLPNGTTPILIGCLLALSFDRLRQMRISTWAGWVPAFAAASAIQIYLQDVGKVVPGFSVLVGVVTAAVVARSLLVSDDWLGRMLNSRVLSTLGTLSYSLYIWQQLFLVVPPWGSGPLFRFPFNIALALGAATLSYLCIERPFLRLKRRFAA